MSIRRWWWIGVLVVAVACGDDDGTIDVDGGVDAGVCSTTADCDDGLFCNGAESCDPDATGADARGCVAGASPCLATQSCDETARECATDCPINPDADGDGFDAIECGGTDCDDADPRRNPGATEVCDLEGLDEDCDDSTIGDRDLDGDGAIDSVCCNGDTCGTDCNDLVRAINPGSPEVCNGYDDDCDGLIDEGVTVPSWPDRDFDLHGDRDAPMEMRCAGAHGYATVNDDCDDTAPNVHSAQVEICDGIDNDCDGTVDESPSAVTWFLDADDDGFGDPTMTRVSCIPLPGYSLRGTDCDDDDPARNPGQVELCNGIDDNCDGRADALIAPGDTEDDDLDGQADINCPIPGPDCDDRDPLTFRGAHEFCDGRDNDCNGLVDDGTAEGIWYRDDDGDTFGDATAPSVMSCDLVAGYIPRAGDCDDTDPARHPGRRELCDGVDQDCDGSIDEGSDRRGFFVDGDNDGFGSGAPIIACSLPEGAADNASDCDDTDASIGAAPPWWVDADMDGAGAGIPDVACTAPSGRVGNDDDCDDTDALVRPGATERCNGRDDDCDATIDEGAAASCTIPNATALCTAGACVLDACVDGFDDCAPGTPGCESEVSEDPANCGRCGMACEAHENCRDAACVSISDLVLGASHACALLSNGEVLCWGDNTYAQLGRGTVGSTSFEPRLVQLFTTLPLNDAIQIAAHPSTNHTCALRADHTVWCWGTCAFGECGPNASSALETRAIPVELGDVAQIAVGGGGQSGTGNVAGHTCAVLRTGGVRCFGYDGFGQLGDGVVTTTANPTPAAMVDSMGEITDALEVGAGAHFTCVRRAAGARVSCAGRQGSGSGWSGQLGRGSLAAGSYPVAGDVTLPVGTTVTGLSVGATHSCLTRAGARPMCWGICTAGECGTGPLPRQELVPVPVPLILNETQQIVASDAFTCARYVNPVTGPRVACFGTDSSEQLGNGGLGGGATPNDVVTAADGTTYLGEVRELASNGTTSCAVLANGRVACWGSNRGQVFGTNETSGVVRPFCDTSRGPDLP